MDHTHTHTHTIFMVYDTHLTSSKCYSHLVTETSPLTNTKLCIRVIAQYSVPICFLSFGISTFCFGDMKQGKIPPLKHKTNCTQTELSLFQLYRRRTIWWLMGLRSTQIISINSCSSSGVGFTQCRAPLPDCILVWGSSFCPIIVCE